LIIACGQRIEAAIFSTILVVENPETKGMNTISAPLACNAALSFFSNVSNV
jgi:hypothetical protein